MSCSILAEDARWILDMVISAGEGTNYDVTVGLILFGHLSRIAYEGARFLQSSNAPPSLAPLVALLPAQTSSSIVRARHAVKLLDDNKKTYQDLLMEMQAYLAAHQQAFLGKAHPLFRRWERDLGLYFFDGCLVGATVPMQQRIGAEPSMAFADIPPTYNSLARELGGVLSVLAVTDGVQHNYVGTLSFGIKQHVKTKDVLSRRYFAERYSSGLSAEAKLLLLMLEAEAGASLSLLEVANEKYSGAVLRARFISLFHLLNGIKKTLDTYPMVASARSALLQAFLSSHDVQLVFQDPDLRRLRNVFMHYGIHPAQVDFRLEEPMYGLVEQVTQNRNIDDLSKLVTSVTGEAYQVLQDWRG